MEIRKTVSLPDSSEMGCTSPGIFLSIYMIWIGTFYFSTVRKRKFLSINSVDKRKNVSVVSDNEAGYTNFANTKSILDCIDVIQGIDSAVSQRTKTLIKPKGRMACE